MGMIGGSGSWKLHITAQKIPVHRTCIYLFCNTEQQTGHALHTTTVAAISSSRRSSSSSTKFTSEFATGDYSVTCSNSRPTYDYNVRMRALGRRGNVNAARKLFDDMPERNKVSYASMISLYLKHDEFHKAEKLFYEIPKGMRGIVGDSAMVNAYAKAGKIDRAEELFYGMPESNSFSRTCLIAGYFQVWKLNAGLELFSKMPERDNNEITWTNAIMGFARNGLIEEARHAFDRMPVKSVVTWTSMIKAYVDNALVDGAFKLFHVMPQRNVYSWNIMIHGFLDDSRINEAEELFDSMSWKNAVSWTTVVTGLGRNGMTDLADKYFEQMPNKDISAWNAHGLR